MPALIDTIFNSLQDLLESAIKAFPGLFAGVVILLLTRFFAKTIKKFAARLAGRTLKSRSLQLLLIKTSEVTAWVIGVVFAAVVAFPGLELGDIIATLGLSSVAIGFAFQDIVKNLFAGILLLFQEPFRIGDEISIEDYSGIVEHIDIRTTQIRTYTGEQVLIPNSTVFTSSVTVKTAYESRRTDLAVGVDYNTSLRKALMILQETITQVEGVLHHRQPEIDLVNFGDSSIDFVVRYWTSSQEKDVRRAQTMAVIAIKEKFDEANITIPYPIRTVYQYDQTQFNESQPSR